MVTAACRTGYGVMLACNNSELLDLSPSPANYGSHHMVIMMHLQFLVLDHWPMGNMMMMMYSTTGLLAQSTPLDLSWPASA
jgi:hypothetical protein